MEKMTAVYVLASEIDSFWRAFCGSFYGIPNVIPNISGVLSVLNVVEDPFMEKMGAVYVLAGEVGCFLRAFCQLFYKIMNVITNSS